MNPINKKELSESDICDLYITPAIIKAGWVQGLQMRREVCLTPGPVVVHGNMSARNKKMRKFADYVLSWEPDMPVAIVEEFPLENFPAPAVLWNRYKKYHDISDVDEDLIQPYHTDASGKEPRYYGKVGTTGS